MAEVISMTYQQVGVTHPDESFEEVTSGAVVTGQRIVVDGDSDKEVVILDPATGASSNAPANSGIPSAVTQQGARTDETGKPNINTPMGDRVQRHEESYAP
jgi:hypothetical protein